MEEKEVEESVSLRSHQDVQKTEAATPRTHSPTLFYFFLSHHYDHHHHLLFFILPFSLTRHHHYKIMIWLEERTMHNVPLFLYLPPSLPPASLVFLIHFLSSSLALYTSQNQDSSFDLQLFEMRWSRRRPNLSPSGRWTFFSLDILSPQQNKSFFFSEYEYFFSCANPIPKEEKRRKKWLEVLPIIPSPIQSE